MTRAQYRTACAYTLHTLSYCETSLGSLHSIHDSLPPNALASQPPPMPMRAVRVCVAVLITARSLARPPAAPSFCHVRLANQHIRLPAVSLTDVALGLHVLCVLTVCTVSPLA